MKNKVSSFTLVEITIVLLISGIIVTIMFRFFSFTNNFKHDRILLSNEIRKTFISRKLLLKSFSDPKTTEKIESNLEVEIKEEESNNNEYLIKTFFISNDDFSDTLIIQKKKSELERLEDL